MLVLALPMEIHVLRGSQLAWSFSCRNLGAEAGKSLPRRVFSMMGKVWGSRRAWSWVGGAVLGHPFKGMDRVGWQAKPAGVARRSTK